MPAECQLPGAASESVHLSGKQSWLQDVPTREHQVSETTGRKMESPLSETHALQTENPERECLHPGTSVSGEKDTLSVTQGLSFPYHSNITSNTDQRYGSLEWTRSSSVWSDKSMDAGEEQISQLWETVYEGKKKQLPLGDLCTLQEFVKASYLFFVMKK